ncbi:hypothetical protein DM02DRAFT_668889 [Periconia macrospinosa]|uniref:Uncharacterized protein n=1 Tax=Periconia macrospinosa TaxID=97972 RepID=A0A2V1E3B6_9PLEO|nr:hypothetical protein DM02DRAFT_668889 [Periconia macrospinosa]
MSPPIPLTTLFLTEGTLKLISGFTFILSPHSILKNLYPSSPSPSQHPSYPPVSVALTRIFGSQTIAFSIPLFFAARADKRIKKLVYLTMLAREGCLAAILLGQLTIGYFWEGKGEGVGTVEGGDRILEEGRVGEVKGEGVRREMESVALRRGLWVWLAEVAPFVVARVAVLGWGSWFV